MSHIHIPDGVLPVWLWLIGWIGAAILVGVMGRIALADDYRRKVPMLGVIAALMMVAMSSEIIPIAYHINLTVLGGILLGPVLSPIAAFIVVTTLALIGHGGVTVIGLNTIVIFSEMLVGWMLFRALIGLFGKGRASIAAFATTIPSLALSTLLLVGIVWLGGGGDLTARETGALDPGNMRFENPFGDGVFKLKLLDGGDHGHDQEHGHEHDHAHDHDHAYEEEKTLSVTRFATVVFTLGPIGWLLEGLIIAAIIGFIAQARPSLVFEGALSGGRHSPPGDETGPHR